MKNIKNILAVAILLIFAVACTDENDLENNATNHINLKTLGQDYRKYASFEDKTFTDDQIKSMIYDFNNAVNNTNVIMPDYDISTALFDMEFHFNYGVVVKMPYDTNAAPYDKLSFSFSVPIEDSIIDGTTLKNAYINFVNSVVEQMNGKNLELSDWYVKDISSTSVTFGLDMEHLYLPYGADNNTMPAINKIKDPNYISVPVSLTSRWDNLPLTTDDNGIYQYYSYETVIHNNSFERLPSNYFISPGKIYVYAHFRGNYGGNFGNQYIFNAGSQVVWNNTNLNNFISNAITKANACNQYSQWGWVVYNYSPIVYSSRNILNQQLGIYQDKYQLSVRDVTSAKLSYIDIGGVWMYNITSPL